MAKKASIIPAEPGHEVSNGTLDTAALLAAFRSELHHRCNTNERYFRRHDRKDLERRMRGIQADALRLLHENADEPKLKRPEREADVARAQYLVGRIIPDLLDLFSPPYCRFGNHPGDTSLYGYWMDQISIEDLPTLEDGVEHPKQEGDYKTVNDHGNISIYSYRGKYICGFV